jgi:hypothetical protein
MNRIQKLYIQRNDTTSNSPDNGFLPQLKGFVDNSLVLNDSRNKRVNETFKSTKLIPDQIIKKGS